MSMNLRGGNSRYARNEPVFVEAGSDVEEVDDQLVGEENGGGGGSLANDIDVQQHVTKDMFARAQEAIIDFDLVASPSELSQVAQSHIMKLLPHLHKEFKQNMALSNRHMATSDQLAGNLHRCIPLHMEVLMHQNTFPFAIGLNITGMLPTNLHRTGKAVWRIPPLTNTMMVKESPFQPQSIVNRYMYANYRMCTLEDLASDIRHVPGSGKKVAHYAVSVGSLAHEWMLDKLDNGAWKDQRSKINMAHLYEPGRDHTVNVTEAMGKELMAELEGPVREAADSFIDLQTFAGEFVRADGIAEFATPKNIAGEIVGSEKVSGTKLTTDLMQTRCSVHVKTKLT